MENVNIESQLKAIEQGFNNLESARQSKIQERRKIDQHLAEIREEQLRLQGEYRVFKKILDPKADQSKSELIKSKTAKNSAKGN